ncbi:hypothetical protein ACJQWK_02668 [Exserohilum turcicum]
MNNGELLCRNSHVKAVKPKDPETSRRPNRPGIPALTVPLNTNLSGSDYGLHFHKSDSEFYYRNSPKDKLARTFP